MPTQCYALVRGQSLRLTGLDRRGALPDTLSYVVSKSVIKVTINEVTESGGNEMLRNEANERRILLRRPDQTIRYTVDIDFLRVDPGMINLLTGFPLVSKPQDGQFGIDAFGVFPFGGGESTAHVGYDAVTKLPPVSFALEVWSKLAGPCNIEAGFGDGEFGDMAFGEEGNVNVGRQYGYTLFPFLKGGRLGGFSYANGLVSFSLVGAQTRRMSKWGRGPYDLDGVPSSPLAEAVSGNTHWRQVIVSGAPPVQTDGIQTINSVIDGGTATMTTSDVLDGGTATATTPAIANGGKA